MKVPLKLLATASLLFFCHFFSVAQPAFNASTSHDNYWIYRNRFKTQFVKIGTAEGNSIPLADRWDAVLATDEDNLGNKFCVPGAGKIGSGDALSFIGWYMNVLATEYKLLHDAGKPTQATLNEIYYVIETINRIDENGEEYFGITPSSANKNGFLSRDDFDASSTNHWLSQQNTQMAGTDNFANMKKKSDGTCEIKDDVTDGDPNGNIMSQDHIINVFMGFAFIKKFVPNEFVKPLSTDRGFNLHTEMATIVRRIMGFVTTTRTETVSGGPCGTLTKQFNWVTVHPLTGSRLSAEKGGDFSLISGPLAALAEFVTGQDEFNTNNIINKDFQNCPDINLSFSLERSMGLFNSAPEINDIASSTVGDYIVNTIENVHDFFSNKDLDLNEPIVNNVNLFLPLACTVGDWTQSEMKDITEDFNLPFYELLYAVFKDKTSSNWGQTFWEDKLRTIPILHNPTRMFEEDPTWGHTTVFTHNNRVRPDEPKGYFNGLDYMLLYNLYHIIFQPQNVTYQESSCDCAIDAIKTFHFDAGNWDESYKWFGNSVEVEAFNTSTPFVVNRYHPDYADRGINTYEYFSVKQYEVHDVGELHVRTPAILCNAKTMTVYDGGQLIIGGTGTQEIGTLLVRKGGMLILSDGTLMINNNSKLIIEEGGTLQINPGFVINLNGSNAVLEIRGLLDIQNGATFQTTGTGYVLFNIKKPPFADPVGYNIKACSTCQMIFENATGNPKTLKLAIAAGTFIYPQAQMDLFKVENAAVNFLGDKASIKLGGKFHLVNGDFTGAGPLDGGDGITITHLTHTNYITHNSFSNLNRALTFINYLGMPDAKIRYNNFSYCTAPIILAYQSAHVAGNNFENCGGVLAGTTMGGQLPIKAGLYQGPLRIELNKFKNSLGGIVMGRWTTPVTITGNSHYYTTSPNPMQAGGYTIAYITDKANSTLKCNYFENFVETVTGYTDGELNLSSARISQITTKTGGAIPGGHNIFKNNLKSLYIYDREDETRTVSYFLQDGYNSFYLPNSGAKWSSLHVERPNNFPGINFVVDGNNNIQIDNNYWTPVLSTSNYSLGWPSNVIEKNIGGNSYYSPHYYLHDISDPSYVVGTQSSATSTCPISAWSDAITDPINFNPSSVSGFTLASADGEKVYIDRPFDLDEQDLDNPVSSVPAGVYNGQNFGTAYNSAVGGLTEPTTDEEENVVYIPTNTGLLNMADLLSNTAWASTKAEIEMFNYGYSQYLICLDRAMSLDIFEGNSVTLTTQLNAALSVFTAIEANNAGYELSDPVRYYEKKIAVGIEKAHLYRLFKQYSNALTTLNSLASIAEPDDVTPIDYLICHTDKESKLFNNEINIIEFESAIFNCASIYGDDNKLGFTLDSTYWQDTLGGDTGSQPDLTFTMSPNPATTQITVDISLNVSGVVKVAVFDSYGIKVVNDITLGSLSAGSHQTTVPLSGLTSGVYTMVVYLDDLPYSQNFVKVE